MANQSKFDLVTLRAPKDSGVGGDYYGLPWPCWGTPELKHPGTHTLYNTNLHVMDGGSTFRARFGVEREVKLPDGTTRKDNLLAEGSYSLGSEIQDGYPEFTYGVLKKLGWDKDLTPAEKGRHRARRRQQSRCGFVGDRSLRRHPAGGDGARLHPLRQRQGARQCVEPARSDSGAPRADLHAAGGPRRQISDAARRQGIPRPEHRLHRAKDRGGKGIAKQFPLILTSGRLVEYEGGGEETRSNKWLAELQQDMFIEINPADAAERGIRDGGWVFVWGPEMESGKATRYEGARHRARGQGRDLVSVPLRRLVPDRRPARELSERLRPDRARREREYDHDLRI
jgi:formate dehydrogenase major subunit